MFNCSTRPKSSCLPQTICHRMVCPIPSFTSICIYLCLDFHLYFCICVCLDYQAQQHLSCHLHLSVFAFLFAFAFVFIFKLVPFDWLQPEEKNSLHYEFSAYQTSSEASEKLLFQEHQNQNRALALKLIKFQFLSKAPSVFGKIAFRTVSLDVGCGSFWQLFF